MLIFRKGKIFRGIFVTLRNGIAFAISLACSLPAVPAPTQALLSARPWASSKTRNDYEKYVGVYSNADAAPILPVLKLAKESVDIEIYEMEDPNVLKTLSQHISKKIKVRIVKDDSPVGKSCRTQSSKTPSTECKPFFDLVQKIKVDKNGSQFAAFNKDLLCGQTERKGRCYQHGKTIIVDKKIALISTGNFNTSNLCDREAKLSTCNRDYTVVTTNKDIISALSEIFNNDLNARRTDIPAVLKKWNVENKLTVSPFSYEPLVKFLKSAKSSIQIQNQYLLANSELIEVLHDLAQKVDVKIQLADICYYGRGKPQQADKRAYELTKVFHHLEDGGAKIRMFSKRRHLNNVKGYLHAKAIVVDGQRAWVGSVNGAYASLQRNREFGLFVDNKKDVSELQQIMAADFDHPSSQTWRDSIHCRDIGYKSPGATLRDDDNFKKAMQSLIQRMPADNKDEDDFL